jgi:hypothetical protein
MSDDCIFGDAERVSVALKITERTSAREQRSTKTGLRCEC